MYVTKYIKPITCIVPYTYIHTSLGVCMRSPTIGRFWVGWSDKETEEHLKSVRNYLRMKKATISS